MPTFREPVARPGGYMVYINVPSGATVYYTSNGSTPTTSSNKYAGGIDVKTSCTIKAIAVKGSAKSGVASRAVSVGQVAQPTITSTLTSSDMCVTLDCSTYGAKIYYTLDGSAPSPYKYYYNGSPIRLTSSATIKAYAIKDGCADSPTAQKTVSVTVPSAPGIDIPTGTTVAVGDPIEIRWTARENATSHIVRVYRNGALVDKISVSGNRFAYIPQVSGAYTFGVDAVNFAGVSSSDSGKTVTAKDPVTVRFVDYDGSVIKEQTVRYGYNASVPLTPKRKGWVFRDWDSHDYLRATGNMTIKALYDREKYIVRFVDEDGITLAAQQEVEFESAVVLPQDPTTTLAGYEFMGWRVISSDTSSALDYNCVDANMTLQAVFDWGNKDLPVAVQTVSATKNDANSYAVDVTLNNGASETTYCRMLVTLKTSTGKAVQTIIRDVTLQPRETGRIVSESEIICDKVATVVEINIVGLDGNRTGGAYSSAKTATISDKSNYYYSEWSTVKPNVSDYETKTMYRYRTREYTTSTSPSLSGWTQYDAITTYSDWGATQNTTSAPAVSDTLQIVGSPTTTYTYYHYCCNYYNGKNNVDSIPYGSGKHYYHEFTRSSPLPAFNMADKGGKQAYGGSGSGAPICMTNGWYAWFLKSATTTYSYQTRTKTTTYYYYRWSDFTPFGDAAVSATNDREVQTATYYRYKIYNEVATSGEDNRGKTYTNANMELPGVIAKTDLDLSGKKANVIVYKASLNDPTASHIEYVGQITIGAGNTYDISFVPAQEPDDAESNYTVSLAIEGQTSLFNIGTIYCSKSKYQVDFYADGTLINTQTVEEGKDAVVPTPPEIPGKTFVGWDNDTTNVIAPRTIKAYYVDETYSVVFADFENDFISMNQYTYGEVISVPSVDAVEGKTFLGWEGLDEDNPIATEHAIFIAKYDTGTFTVKFDDGFGNILSTQTIEYGESATPPDAPEKEGYVFMGWRTDVAWWNAKSDMIVTPIWIYENTAATPEVNVENLYFGGEITAKTDTAGATVYYAIDDGRGAPPVTLSQRALEKVNIEVSDTEIEEESGNVQPLSLSLADLLVTDAYAYDEEYDYGEEAYDYYEWLEYDESMVFTENATFYFYAAGDNMNDSEIVTLDYAYEPVMNPYEDHTGETHTVTFIDYDGFVLDEQTVEYFKDATAPEIEEREGYVFIGWDTDFTHVINDIEVTAQYVPENEYVTFTLNTDSVTMTAGSTYSLNLTVTNDPGDLGEIIWKSSNNSVASVNADGFILANNSGEAIITAKSENNIYSAKCKVVVLPDANKTVVLRNDSKLSLEGGFLTQIPIASSGIHRAATVAEIKKQIATQNVTIVDSDGNVLEDTDTVTTNTAIRLIADDVVIDAVIIIVTGDYDCNGVVNNRDAARIMRYLVNKESPNESQIYAIDVNGDGSVNNRDAAMVSRYLVGKETL
ncbi:MAG: InlB B-repeat-containing protein [Acutalibacteraceae bacterium]